MRWRIGLVVEPSDAEPGRVLVIEHAPAADVAVQRPAAHVESVVRRCSQSRRAGAEDAEKGDADGDSKASAKEHVSSPVLPRRDKGYRWLRICASFRSEGLG
jgi:hypothetical protein